MDLIRHPSKRLTFDDAVEVWLLHFKGIFQNQIAARFDCNPARVNDILKERKHKGSKAAARGEGPAQPDLFAPA